MILAVIILTLLLCYMLYKRYKFASMINQIPIISTSMLGTGVRGLLGVTRMQSMSQSGVSETLTRMCEGWPHLFTEGIMCAWIGPIPYVFIMSPEMAECVLKNNDITRKAGIVRFLTPILGNGLFTSHGDKWRKTRKLLTPAFHFQILEKLMPVFNRCAKIFINKLEQEVAANGFVSNMSPHVLLCTLDVIGETAMGERINAQSDPDAMYAKMIHSMGDTFVERCIKPWLHMDQVFKRTRMGKEFHDNVKWTQEYTESVIRKRTEEIRKEAGLNPEDKDSKDPFMTILIREHAQESSSSVTDLSIRDEVNTFIIAGHDSTGWATNWCIYLLGLHPEQQSRVQAEVDSIPGSDERDLTFDEVKNCLPFTEAAVKESLRLFPSIPFFTRITESETIVGKYTIPAGVQLMVNVIAVHRDRNHWVDCQKFIPDRFLEQEGRNPFSFLPFSAGLRNCIGQKFAMLEMKALIANLFRRFRVTSLDPRDRILVTCSPTMKTRSAIRIRLDRRVAVTPHHLVS